MAGVVRLLGWTLWWVGAAAVLAGTLRVATTGQRRSLALPRLLAGKLVSASALLTLLGPEDPALRTAAWACAVLAVLAVGAGTVAVLRTFQRLRTTPEWLDLVSGVLLALAIVLAAALQPLSRRPGLGVDDAARLLSLPALAAIALVLTVIAARLVRSVRRLRSALFVSAVSLLLACAVAAALAGGASAGAAGALATVEQAAAAGALVLLCATAWTREPPLFAAFEPVGEVMPRRLVQLVVIGVLLLVDQVAPLPAAATALALAAMGVQVVSIALVYRLVTGLRATRLEAVTDELTGLGNRRALTRALHAVDGGSAAALVLIDLDRFKEVNDVLGHAAGDELLRQVAERLRERSSPVEVLVRQGGDEFALVAADATAAQACARARALAARLAAPFPLTGGPVTIAASIGVAAAPEHAATAEELLQKADAAMYAAKENGSGPQVYDRATDRARRDEQALAVDLRRAIGTDELRLAFQPQVESGTGAVVGLEALVRWCHPLLGTLGARRFLPLAARHGFMEALTAQVLRSALASLPTIDRAGGPCRGARVSVNVSASSLHHSDLVTMVSRALTEHEVAPERLVLEITETELMVDPAASRRVIEALVHLGVGVSIDDYGTGHSSLAYLRDLPASELKLDRCFVEDLTTDRRTADIVRTTVDLAHSLGLRLVAEGVEDAGTLDALVALGADVTQGFHHCGPLSAAGLAAWAGPAGAPHAGARGGLALA